MHQPMRHRGATVRGDVVRRLRRSRNWTQEEAAHRAGLSEKLIRKAERGEPLDLSSIAALAKSLSSPKVRVTPEELIQTPAADPRQGIAASAIEAWLHGVWRSGDLAAVDALFAEAPQFLCGAGRLTTRAAIKERIDQARKKLRPIGVEIEATSSSETLVDCRWRLAMRGTGVPAACVGEPPSLVVVTSLRLDAGRIVEAREFWDVRSAMLHRSECCDSNAAP